MFAGTLDLPLLSAKLLSDQFQVQIQRERHPHNNRGASSVAFRADFEQLLRLSLKMILRTTWSPLSYPVFMCNQILISTYYYKYRQWGMCVFLYVTTISLNLQLIFNEPFSNAVIDREKLKAVENISTLRQFKEN